MDINYSAEEKEMRLCIESEQTTETTTKITTETNTEASTVQKTKSPKETSNNTPESGIRKEISEFLDSYEDFMNEYADFMKKYEKADSNNQTKMLADYLDYCDKYADFTQKYEDIKDKKLNNDELAYYIKVQNRVSKKLLSE